MAFTMHSHSGQFCPGHAKDQLEDVVRQAISVGMKTIGLTEHMPRTHLSDLYPEELEEPGPPEATLAGLMPRHVAYMREARRLRAKYAGEIEVLVGFEGEFIRDEYGPLIKSLVDGSHPACCREEEDEEGRVVGEDEVDFFIGSLHHAGTGVPIDFDEVFYAKARDEVGGTEELLFEDYYEQQFRMLRALKPPVVGHFDLIRLMSVDPGRDVRVWSPKVWGLIKRNLEFVAGYGGWLECNSSALRKGLAEPYPARPIAEEWLRLGGRFTFSDDSHGVAQVATNYPPAFDYLESLGVEQVWTYERQPVEPGERSPDRSRGASKANRLVEKSVKLSQFRADLNLEKN